jgi:flagellar hook-associated protein 2
MMGSPVTLSGFNNIDFTQILNAIMAQERQPVTVLESQKEALEAQKSTFGTLASRLGSLESAIDDVVDPTALRATAVTVSDTTRLSASAGASTPEGTFQIFVDQLARAQVTTGRETFADTDTAIAARKGTLTFTKGGATVDVVLGSDVTLQGLADAINASDTPATASIVRNASGRYHLMLTGKEAGAGSGFTVDGKNAGNLSFSTVQASRDAHIRLNGVAATSTTNTFDGVINGLSFTALKEDAANPVLLTITASYESVVNLVQKIAAAFNDTTKFIGEQTAAAGRGEKDNIGRDSLVRGLRTQLTRVLTQTYDVGGRFASLAEIGFELTRAGELKLNESTFREAVAKHRDDVERLFRGSDGTGGVFGSLTAAVEHYTRAGGLVPNAQDRLSEQLARVSDRVAIMEERLAVRRAALQQEFIAADRVISQLNAQQGSLTSLGSQYRLF